ncbi:hypothetical protein SteCoe_11344 [Stentor coeruleus]|uniref:Uncharacterized protein n=1 Tax=Stentor coeruleus TaxID=5963 RepID=A0A1R2CDG6_9CILI|nr:hypothetical protein SteCoe_11344 [Stentor coeruleus]
MVKFLIDLYEEVVSDEVLKFADAILLISKTSFLSDAAKYKFKYCEKLNEALEATGKNKYFRISCDLERGIFIGAIIETFPNIRVFRSKPSKLYEIFDGIEISSCHSQKVVNFENKNTFGFYKPREVQNQPRPPLRYEVQDKLSPKDNFSLMHFQNKDRNKLPVKFPAYINDQYLTKKYVSELDAMDSDKEKSLVQPTSYYPGTQANYNPPRFVKFCERTIPVAKPQFSSFAAIPQISQENMQMPKKISEHGLASNKVPEYPKNLSQGTISEFYHPDYQALGKTPQFNNIESPNPQVFNPNKTINFPNSKSSQNFLPLKPNSQSNIYSPSLTTPASMIKTFPAMPKQGPKSSSLTINTTAYKILNKKKNYLKLLSKKHSYAYGEDSKYHELLIKLLMNNDFDRVDTFKDLFSLFYKNVFDEKIMSFNGSYNKTLDNQGNYGINADDTDINNNFLEKLAEIQKAITRLFEVGYFRLKNRMVSLENLFKGNIWDCDLVKSENLG